MTHWTPREEAQFDRRCAYCSKRIRRTGLPGGWQGYDGVFTCWRGELPMRSDLGRRHTPEPDPDPNGDTMTDPAPPPTSPPTPKTWEEALTYVGEALTPGDQAALLPLLTDAVVTARAVTNAAAGRHSHQAVVECPQCSAEFTVTLDEDPR